MNKLFFMLCALLSALGALHAQGQPRVPEVVVDIVQFRGDGARTKWEFQYSFPDTAVRYAATPSQFEGALLCSLTVVSEQGDTVRDEWLASAASPSSYVVHKQFLSGIRTLMVTPGKHTVHFRASDVNEPSAVLTSMFTSTVRSFGYATSMSDIMFVAPSAANVDSRFVRNTIQAVPNPRHELVGADPSLCFYAEVYNALRDRIDTMAVEFAVLDNIREELMVVYAKLAVTSDGLVLREEIPAGALRSGVYTFRVRLRSADLEREFASAEERFFILNPELPPEGRILLAENELFLASEWAVTTGERLEVELQLSDVLATNAEKAIRVQCTDERCKQRYLYRFWRERDPDENTMANERLDEFRKMYQRAQMFYSSPSFRDGWKTDRGIILLRYGVPTQVTQYIQTIDTKPYEEWFYQGIQGGSYFYFVDWQLQQNHRLVHSTMIGQVRDPNWFNNYAKAFGPDPNPLQQLRPPQR